MSLTVSASRESSICSFCMCILPVGPSMTRTLGPQRRAQGVAVGPRHESRYVEVRLDTDRFGENGRPGPAKIVAGAVEEKAMLVVSERPSAACPGRTRRNPAFPAATTVCAGPVRRPRIGPACEPRQKTAGLTPRTAPLSLRMKGSR